MVAERIGEISSARGRRSTAARSAAPGPGAIIDGRFVLESSAADGGMGAIFRGRDERDGAAVAVKLINSVDPADTERFLLEADILARLRHPGIVRHIAHGI